MDNELMNGEDKWMMDKFMMDWWIDWCFMIGGWVMDGWWMMDE
jgi:hypothetical protein